MKASSNLSCLSLYRLEKLHLNPSEILEFFWLAFLRIQRLLAEILKPFNVWATLWLLTVLFSFVSFCGCYVLDFFINNEEGQSDDLPKSALSNAQFVNLHFLFSLCVSVFMHHQTAHWSALTAQLLFWALEQSEVLTQYVRGPPCLLGPIGSQLTADTKCSSTGVLKQLFHAADGTLFHTSVLSKWWYLDSFLTDFWFTLKLTKHTPSLPKRTESPNLFHFRIVQVYS